jgi:hypothetical protein
MAATTSYRELAHIKKTTKKIIMANCAICSVSLTMLNKPIRSKMNDGGVLCTKCVRELNKVAPDVLFKLKKYSTNEIKTIFETHKKPPIQEKILEDRKQNYKNENNTIMEERKEILVTTGDLKREYAVIGPIYYQISNKGLFSNELSKMTKKYKAEIEEMKKAGLSGRGKMDWGFLYGEFSFGMQNNFESAFFIAVRELQKRAQVLEADAVIGMRQDIDLDTNQFQYFYLQMYGTAIKYI